MLSLAIVTPMCLAVTPASKQYVDAKVADLKAQIAVIPGVAHPVGSCFGGGVVFYVNTESGSGAQQHGLIAAPTDASASAAWRTGTGNPSGLTTNGTYFTGESNTVALLAAVHPDPPGRNYPAAVAAAGYSTAGDTCAECTPWYLPAQDELATLYAQASSSIALGHSNFWTNCGGVAPVTTPGGGSYWSSTASAPPSTSALVVIFSSGQVAQAASAGSTFHVRSVRAF